RADAANGFIHYSRAPQKAACKQDCFCSGDKRSTLSLEILAVYKPLIKPPPVRVKGRRNRPRLFELL
ncbi:MAG: hypothetical protein UV57_C0042G0001, partial [Parcubacteria group bacterium GW2011_GWD2_43_10]